MCGVVGRRVQFGGEEKEVLEERIFVLPDNVSVSLLLVASPRVTGRGHAWSSSSPLEAFSLTNGLSAFMAGRLHHCCANRTESRRSEPIPTSSVAQKKGGPQSLYYEIGTRLFLCLGVCR